MSSHLPSFPRAMTPSAARWRSSLPTIVATTRSRLSTSDKTHPRATGSPRHTHTPILPTGPNAIAWRGAQQPGAAATASRSAIAEHGLMRAPGSLSPTALRRRHGGARARLAPCRPLPGRGGILPRRGIVAKCRRLAGARLRARPGRRGYAHCRPHCGLVRCQRLLRPALGHLARRRVVAQRQ